MGLRQRAASTSAKSWVLSPISASATTPVETSNACIASCKRASSDVEAEVHHIALSDEIFLALEAQLAGFLGALLTL